MTYCTFTSDERKALNRIGATSGCHSCGTKNPGTLSRNWIADPQPPSAVNWGQTQQRIYPHCLRCKRIQAFSLREFIIRNGRAPWTGADVFGCVIFVADARCKDAPNEMDFSDNIYRSESCLALGCVSYMDGTPQIVFGAPNHAQTTLRLVHTGAIATPSKWLAVFTADQDMIAGVPVTGVISHVQVWTNHSVEPDKIFIAAS